MDAANRKPAGCKPTTILADLVMALVYCPPMEYYQKPAQATREPHCMLGREGHAHQGKM